MAKGPAPTELIRCLEDLFEGQDTEEVIFALSLTLGNAIGQVVRVDLHELRIAACLSTIRLGIEGAIEAKEKIETIIAPSTSTKH